MFKTVYLFAIGLSLLGLISNPAQAKDFKYQMKKSYLVQFDLSVLSDKKEVLDLVAEFTQIPVIHGNAPCYHLVKTTAVYKVIDGLAADVDVRCKNKRDLQDHLQSTLLGLASKVGVHTIEEDGPR